MIVRLVTEILARLAVALLSGVGPALAELVACVKAARRVGRVRVRAGRRNVYGNRHDAKPRVGVIRAQAAAGRAWEPGVRVEARGFGRDRELEGYRRLPGGRSICISSRVQDGTIFGKIAKHRLTPAGRTSVQAPEGAVRPAPAP